MKTMDVVDYFGSLYKASQRLGLTRQSVGCWGYRVPRSAVADIQAKTKGKLKYRATDYELRQFVDGMAYKTVKPGATFNTFTRMINDGRKLFFKNGEHMESVYLGGKAELRKRFREFELYELVEEKAP